MKLRLATHFSLVLLVALVGANMVAALLMAREGSDFDRAIRVQGDMGRLVALVSALEEVDELTGERILARSNTGFTRFSIDPVPLARADARALPAQQAQIARVLPDRAILTFTGGAPQADAPVLQMVSVALVTGAHRGKWLNSLVYPLPSHTAWQWKSWFFAPLLASLVGTLGVGLIFVRRMTEPLRELAAAARAAGRGDRAARVRETGARELRDAAAAFNDMQSRIERFNAERMHLVAAIGHDLRTPITSLRIQAEMIDDDDLRATVIPVLDEMTVMANDLLHYGRGTGEGEAPTDTDLSALLAQLCAERDVAFQSGGPLVARIRPVAVRRAVGNLIGNAMRYAGTPTVRLDAHGPDALIAVEDRGPGLSGDQLASALEPFARGDASRSPETGGTGLGLSIARDIAIRHGGGLTLSNRTDGGLRAELRLPLI